MLKLVEIYQELKKKYEFIFNDTKDIFESLECDSMYLKHPELFFSIDILRNLTVDKLIDKGTFSKVILFKLVLIILFLIINFIFKGFFS